MMLLYLDFLWTKIRDHCGVELVLSQIGRTDLDDWCAAAAMLLGPVPYFSKHRALCRAAAAADQRHRPARLARTAASHLSNLVTA